MTADSCFFATMGIDVVSGDPRELNNPEVVFISRELAGSMFADKNPIGQTVVYNKQMPMTVKGIFEDFPENSSFYGSGVVMSLATSFKHHWGYWGGEVETAICPLSVCARGAIGRCEHPNRETCRAGAQER